MSYMKFFIRVPLSADSPGYKSLEDLQRSFADVCNALAILAQQSRCWNRVALHHLAYRPLREQFPQLGSQLICNAIYSVSRACRTIYGDISEQSVLPKVVFTKRAPVYFDRHTISIKAEGLSMMTLNGRMRFDVQLKESLKNRFATDKLAEVVLYREKEGFVLVFAFAGDETHDPVQPEFIQVIPPHVLDEWGVGEHSRKEYEA